MCSVAAHVTSSRVERYYAYDRTVEERLVDEKEKNLLDLRPSLSNFALKAQLLLLTL